MAGTGSPAPSRWKHPEGELFMEEKKIPGHSARPHPAQAERTGGQKRPCLPNPRLDANFKGMFTKDCEDSHIALKSFLSAMIQEADNPEKQDLIGRLARSEKGIMSAQAVLSAIDEDGWRAFEQWQETVADRIDRMEPILKAEERGEERGKQETARNMPARNYPIADIAEITGLPIADIEKLAARP